MVECIIFIMGAIIGSFLNVCIYRLPKNESIISPPSHCPKCGKPIPWHDNVPIVSYLMLMGRCRFCKAKIHWRYPLVEVLTALFLTALFLRFSTTPKFFAYSIMTCGLIVATFIDFETECIPDQVSEGGIVIGLLFALIFPSVMNEAARLHGLLDSLAGMIAGGGCIFILKISGTIMFRKKIERLGIESAMGEGDIYLMAMIGAFLGWKLVLLTFFIAPFFGAVAGIILKIRDGRDIIPYGPHLSLAALVAMFFGDGILRFFLYGLY